MMKGRNLSERCRYLRKITLALIIEHHLVVQDPVNLSVNHQLLILMVLVDANCMPDAQFKSPPVSDRHAELLS